MPDDLIQLKAMFYDIMILRHPGHGNQKVHGNRFGPGQAKESLRRLKDDKAARERYKDKARGKQAAKFSDRPKLNSGYSYGEDMGLSDLRVGQVMHIPGNSRRGTIQGTITKIKPKNIDYETDYMGKPMTLTTSKDDLKGGYVASGKKVHKIL